MKLFDKLVNNDIETEVRTFESKGITYRYTVPHFADSDAMAGFFGFEPLTALDRERVAYCWEIYSNRLYATGTMGRINEILHTSRFSRKIYASDRGKADIASMHYNGKCYTAELKFGQCDYAVKTKGNFVIYTLFLCNSNTKGTVWSAKAKVFRKDYFQRTFNDLGGFSPSKKDGIYKFSPTRQSVAFAIQSYGLDYDRNKNYTDSDFIEAETALDRIIALL